MTARKTKQGVAKMNTIDYSVFTDDELKNVRDEIAEVLKERRKIALEAKKIAKSERAEKFAGEVAEGDVITFLFGTKNTEVTLPVLRANEKTVTVEFEGKRKYVKYERVVAIVSKAPEVSEEEYEEELDEVM